MAVAHTPGVGAPPAGIAQIAGSVGKPGRQQTTTRGVTPSITGGSQSQALMNHYGKNGPSVLAGSTMPGSTGVDPTQHPGVSQLRGGGKGGMKKGAARQGGLGPGPMATAGGDTNYDATSQDVE